MTFANVQKANLVTTVHELQSSEALKCNRVIFMDGSDASVSIVAAKPLEVLVGQKEGAHDQHNVTSAKMVLEVYKADGCEKCNGV